MEGRGEELQGSKEGMEELYKLKIVVLLSAIK